MSHIKIISPGLQTSVQDEGRTGMMHLGVPQSGAADKLSLALANYCLGNPAHMAGLEMMLTGPDIEFSGAAHFALCGAHMSARLNDTPIKFGKAHQAKAGDILKIGALGQESSARKTTAKGARSYLAFAGGIDVPIFMGSRSTYLRGAFGGFQGRVLQAGDELAIGMAVAAPRALPANILPHYGGAFVLNLIEGPEFNWLDKAAQSRIFQTRFTASGQTDRMGARLKADSSLASPELPSTQLPSMSSSAARPGTLQYPPNGQPILLGIDGQTIGGYARIGQIMRADWPYMGQIKPGTYIYFRRCSPDQARQALRQRTAFYQSFMPDFSF